MIFVCHSNSEDHVIKGSCDFICSFPHDKSQSAKFDGHREWGSGDTMFVVIEEQDSTCSNLIHYYYLFLKHVTCYGRINKILQ